MVAPVYHDISKPLKQKWNKQLQVIETELVLSPPETFVSYNKIISIKIKTKKLERKNHLPHHDR